MTLIEHMTATQIDHFLNHFRINQTTQCWIWYKHYPRIRVNGKKAMIGRVAYELFVGECPDNCHIFRACENPKCGNPDHLILSDDERLTGFGYAQLMKTHCPQNHEYTLKNTWVNVKTNGRYCRQCLRDTQKRLYDKRKKTN